MCAKSFQSCPTLCNPMDCSPPDSSVHGILQARILERVAISYSRGSSQARDETSVSRIVGSSFTTEPPGKILYIACMPANSLQLCPTLCNPMDCSLPGSSVHGILQARILEWVAMPSSRGSSQSRDQTCVSCIAGSNSLSH